MFVSPIVRFVKRKWYQYEVTFALYMLNPTEKLIFNTLVLIATTMLIAAITLYFPQHVVDIASRAWFYYAGEEVQSSRVGGAGTGRGGKHEL